MRKKHLSLVYLLCSLTIIASLQGCAPAIVVGSAAGAASVASDTRTAGSIVEDQAIEFRIATKLQADNQMTEFTNINITSYNAIVLLTGEAPTEELKRRAAAFAEQDPKIKRTYNEINITKPLPYKARNYDTFLTAKIKTSLLMTKDVSSFDIKVVTSDTTVYLLGLISRNNADMVTRVVAQTHGVTRIVKAFEYTD